MGSFLAASTFYAAITGRQPGTLDSQVDAGLSLADQERLIDVAASVVLDEPFGRFDWPWVFQWEDWGSETIHGDDIRPLVSIEEEVLADQVQVQDGRLWLRRDGSLTATELSVSSQSEFVWKKGTLSVTRFVGDLQVPEDGILEIPDTTQVEGSMGGIGIVRYDGPTDGRRQVLTADALDLSGATIEVPQDTTWWIEGQALWVGDPSEGPSTESTEGCGCRSAAGGPAGGGWMVLGLAVLLWGRLTRRSWE